MTPLIQTGGKARYDAICEQLQVIIKQLAQISLLQNGTQVSAYARYYVGDEFASFIVRYCAKWTEPFEIIYNVSGTRGSRDFLNWDTYSKDLLSPNGLVTNWNNFEIIDELQKECEKYLQAMIQSQQKKVETITDTLNKIRE